MDLLRVNELVAMVKVKMQMSKQTLSLREDQTDLKFCYDILQHVSRSFASVIIQLHEELRDAVCIFYLVLRGLDTVEDDTSVPFSIKKDVLPVFHLKLLDSEWHIDGTGKGKERELLEKFYLCSRAWQALKPAYRDVISDICKRMADGMMHFLQNEVVTKADYDLYCHYVAGLVGHGLTRLFAESGLESPSLADDLTISNSMGLFLQKCNIIRDYWEDINEEPPRMFWPREVWGNFAKELADFKKPENRHNAVECLNALVADAMKHIPHCMQYLASLKEPSVFLFCAIPQIMAIATLEKVYNNPEVFTSKVKIRKGLACNIILNCDNLEHSLNMFHKHVLDLERRLAEEDPSYDVMRKEIASAKTEYRRYVKQQPSKVREFCERYPALGGRLLFRIVDGISGVIKGQ
jgi:farnesyl-diphosphate farnesyltransferase